eukprot:CAMPEP_0175043688 /NCGR_PEP_ID=MMETSP0052_2-20121109/3342_1 /TAXON_ID=51329 ORGANISM="Polytomella parva, Strain SAG 63-3" /NCGR_SAMPLE_ID=MMETSP0052_2 /ASSEMBLY_ACC=CAM_ASM_000194 /LENGTH=324 /DNA_ID=CAMNT_0016306807 /DNA_START=109 /DNA_END=1080 /DNA_ORIENTATION=+
MASSLDPSEVDPNYDPPLGLVVSELQSATAVTSCLAGAFLGSSRQTCQTDYGPEPLTFNPLLKPNDQILNSNRRSECSYLLINKQDRLDLLELDPRACRELDPEGGGEEGGGEGNDGDSVEEGEDGDEEDAAAYLPFRRIQTFHFFERVERVVVVPYDRSASHISTIRVDSGGGGDGEEDEDGEEEEEEEEEEGKSTRRESGARASHRTAIDDTRDRLVIFLANCRCLFMELMDLEALDPGQKTGERPKRTIRLRQICEVPLNPQMGLWSRGAVKLYDDDGDDIFRGILDPKNANASASRNTSSSEWILDPVLSFSLPALGRGK